MPTPEELAREKIDALLAAAGWSVFDKKEFNRNASLGVALREAGMSGGEADYLLFVAGKAAGVLEAKPSGTTPSGVAEQTDRYMAEVPPFYQKWSDPLHFGYESTGDETYFRDNADPKPRSRRVFAFHKPETLHAWLLEAIRCGPACNRCRRCRRPGWAIARSRPFWAWKREHLDDFVKCYCPAARAKRKESERFKRFGYADLVARDKLNLDIFWFKDESLGNHDDLPPPDMIAAEIVENLEAPLEAFKDVVAGLPAGKG